MFKEKVETIMSNFGPLDIKVAVISTMGVDYKKPKNCTVVVPLDNDLIHTVGTVAKAGVYKVIIIDNIFHLYNSYDTLRQVVQHLSEIAKDYKVTIFT